ncbi:MAG: MFS transporter [Bacteroidetes bacterium]|nr:MAG: MFS transporter [Bacteroidota bacterium]
MGNRFFVVQVALIVALGGFLMGFDASVISGVNEFIEPEFQLTKLELGWAVASLTLTSTLAMMLAGPISDRIGRKTILSVAAVLYAISAIASALAPTFTFLLIARMIGGLGVGTSLIIAPMYIAEISPPKMRGQMVSFNQLNIVIGISAAFFTNYLILKWGKSGLDWVAALGMDQYQWRWMLGVETLPAVLYFFGLLFVPRSPRWLIMKGRYDAALAIMKRANGPRLAEEEMARIQSAIHKDETKARTPIGELFRPAMRLVLLIGLVVAVLQQITGINSVFFYAPMIFKQAGLGQDAAFTQAIWVGMINLVFTLLAIAFIDRLGRKPILSFGVAGIAVFMGLLAYGFSGATYSITEEALKAELSPEVRQQLQPLLGQTYDSDLALRAAIQEVVREEKAEEVTGALLPLVTHLNATLILVGILGFVACFAISVGPVMWVLFSELFPNHIRGLAISFVGLVNSAVSFLVQLVFPWELSNLGSSMTFLLYGLFAVAGLVFILWKVPETKGKSLEELEVMLGTSQ